MSKLALLLTTIWVSSHSFLYGYHISALNGIQTSILCPASLTSTSLQTTKWGLKECLDLTDAQFGVVVTVFTLGGLLGSLGADFLTRRLGRIGVLRLSETIFIIGSGLVGVSNFMIVMMIGRIMVGLAGGLSLVTVPIYLSDILPPAQKRLSGTLHQSSIGVGMIVGQSLSIPFDRLFWWRSSLVVGCGIAALLLVSGLGQKDVEKRDIRETEDGDEETPLISREVESMSVKQLFTCQNKSIKRGFLVVVITQLAQQICGISPVMYFSTKILSSVFQANSKLVTLGIMAIGIPFNFVPGLIPSSFGTKRLLLLSSIGTMIFTTLLAIGLNTHSQILSGSAVVGFVLSFSVGLAPLPWVVLSETVPPEARTAAGTVGVSVNWMTNFVAGSVFLPLQDVLKRGQSEGEGNVFFVFAATCLLSFIAIVSSYRLYDKAQD